MTDRSHGVRMPKQTFFNLPDDKRRLIEQIAADEFAEHGYEAASISQMVSRAGIAKGSFYQYFEDKQDLFMHLVDLVQEEKLATFKDRQAPEPDMDFFSTLRWMFEAGFEYAAAQSRLNQAVSRVLFGEGLFMGQLFKEAREVSSRMFATMIQKAAERGELDTAVDPETGAFVVETLINSLGLFILNQQHLSEEDLLRGGIDWLHSDRARQIIDSVLFILEHGLRK
jgi:TetR/AcrR family transcriptional regulator